VNEMSRKAYRDYCLSSTGYMYTYMYIGTLFKCNLAGSGTTSI
jgi:hypothetical protein